MHWTAVVSINLATRDSIVSAVDCFISFRRKIDTSAKDRRRPAILTRRGKVATVE